MCLMFAQNGIARSKEEPARAKWRLRVSSENRHERKPAKLGGLGAKAGARLRDEKQMAN
jgi:hypothetical protein